MSDAMTRLAEPLTHKTCTCCGETKPLNEFYRKAIPFHRSEPYPDTQLAARYAECIACFGARVKRDRAIS